MTMMKAFVRIDSTSQEVQLMDVPIPEIHTDEVLIKVEAFGVGIHDRYFIPSDANFPYVIGSEGAGVITQTGSQLSSFKVNDRVIFTTVLQAQGGAWAEYAVAKQSSLMALPDDLTFQQGATVPIAGKTALESMRSLDLSKGDKLFIAGASGAIGTIVIQLAKAIGVQVAASASAKNHDYMKALGAEKTVDYHDENWTDQVLEWSGNGVTAALAIQPGTGADSIKVVQDGGKLITVSGDNTSVTPVRDIHVAQMGHHTDTNQRVLEFIDSISKGDIKIEIEHEYSFEQALEALKKTETRHARGKLVVKI